MSTFLPYILYTAGLEKVEAVKASVLVFTEPMVASLCGVIVYHETLHLRNILGIGLIFGAIVLLNVPPGKREKTASPSGRS